MIDIIPEQYKGNPSARKIILSTYQKAQREGKWGGYRTDQASEMMGVEPNSNKRDEYELCEAMPSEYEAGEYDSINPY